MVEVGIRLPQPHEVQDFSTVAEYAQLAESAGIDQLWFSESYGRNMLVPLVLSMDRTDSIEFGTAIANVYSRSPALLAMTAGALAELSDGRFTLGIGASGPAVIENFHGVDLTAHSGGPGSISRYSMRSSTASRSTTTATSSTWQGSASTPRWTTTSRCSSRRWARRTGN